MQRRKFIKTISAASVAIAAPIAIIPEPKHKICVSKAAKSYLDAMMQPEIIDVLAYHMGEGNTIIDLMGKTKRKKLDKYEWND